VQLNGSLGGGISALTHASPGVLAINGANAGFAGTVSATAGTIRLGNVAALNRNNAVSVGTGAILDVNGFETTVAGLNDVSGGGGTVTNASIAPRTLTLGGSGTYAFSGTITATTPANLSLVKTGSGTQRLSGSNTYAGATTVQQGTLVLRGAAQVPVLSGAGGADVQNGQLVFDYTGSTSLLPTIRSLLVDSYAHGLANGRLRSTTVTTRRWLGYRDDGVATVTVMATLFGDADLDGGVSINDFNSLAANFGQRSGKAWVEGDFDYDGGVSINDFNLLASNFGQSMGAAAATPDFSGLLAFAAAHNDLAAFEAVTGVPEPASLTLIAAGATLSLCRRRRLARP
jgi:autotransporter-associated beta strand protein